MLHNKLQRAPKRLTRHKNTYATPSHTHRRYACTATVPATTPSLAYNGVFHTQMNHLPATLDTQETSQNNNYSTIQNLTAHLEAISPSHDLIGNKIKAALHSHAQPLQAHIKERVKNPDFECAAEAARFVNPAGEYTYENTTWADLSIANGHHFAMSSQQLQTSAYNYHRTQRNQISSSKTPCKPLQPIYTPAFALDIDGVLLRDGHLIPDVIPALKRIFSRQNGGDADFQLPVVFMTNGGGCTELGKAEELSQKFGLNITESQIVLAHTPFKSLVPILQDQKIAIIGGRKSPEVAQHYGLKNSFAIRELKELFCDLLAPQAVQDDVPRYRKKSDPAQAHSVLDDVDGIMLVTDSRDWYVDLQVSLDILIKRREANAIRYGIPVGTYKQRSDVMLDHFKHISENLHIESNILKNIPPTEILHDGVLGPVQSTNPQDYFDVIHTLYNNYTPMHTPIYTSNPDFVYSNRYSHPRLAQSAFAETLSYLYTRQTGEQLEFLTIGKPTRPTYRLVEGKLLDQAQQLSRTHFNHQPVVISRNYGVGDNPKADIRGANWAGPNWSSVFVHTGTLPLQSANINYNDVTYQKDIISETPHLHYPSIYECVNEVLMVNDIIQENLTLKY